MPRDKTSLFSLSEIDAELTRKILDEVYDSLKERGYNPTNQIVGYLISGDPGYISSYRDARSKIQEIDRAKIVEILLNELGSRTLGVAVSDKTGLIATSLRTIRHNEEYDRLLVEVQGLVNELGIDAIVLGFPKNMNNSIGPKGELSLDFKSKLEEKLAIPIYLEDERLTTVTANNVLLSGNVSRKNRKKVVDSVAATIILQSYLDRSGRK